jgi:hypothetical protein
MPHKLLKFFIRRSQVGLLMKDFNFTNIKGCKFMNLGIYPKSIKKAVRYIKQDASIEQLEEIKKIVIYAIKKRTTNLQQKNSKQIV